MIKEFRDRVQTADSSKGKVVYSYNETHGLTDIKDPRGITPIRNEYDPVTGRLIRHTGATLRLAGGIIGRADAYTAALERARKQGNFTSIETEIQFINFLQIFVAPYFGDYPEDSLFIQYGSNFYNQIRTNCKGNIDEALKKAKKNCKCNKK